MTEPGGYAAVAPGYATVTADRLDPAGQAAVLRLAEAAAAADGGAALNEDAILHLASAAPDRHHRLVATTGELIGYAQLRVSADGTATADVAVGAADRTADRTAVATALLAAVERSAPGDLLVWSHSENSPVAGAAPARGYREDRVLLVMSRPATPADLDLPVTPPEGVTIRTFVPQADDAAWLGVNRRAFAHHPEQGRWQESDLAERVDQPWFDAAGFFLAFDSDATLLGFHWTKIHAAAKPGERPVGEVYVIGVDPAAQGRGLGALLLRVGLRHLAGAGVSTILLYTDDANRGAVALYLRTGFAVVRREVQFRLSATGTGTPEYPSGPAIAE